MKEMIETLIAKLRADIKDMQDGNYDNMRISTMGNVEMYEYVISEFEKNKTLSALISVLEYLKSFIVKNDNRNETTPYTIGQLTSARKLVEVIEHVLSGKFGETVDAENTVCIPASEYRFVVVGKVAEMLTHELTKWEELCDNETVTGLNHERAEMYALAYRDTLERLHTEYTIDNVEKVLENIKHDYEYYCGKLEERSFGMHIPSTRDALKDCACLIEHLLDTQK